MVRTPGFVPVGLDRRLVRELCPLQGLPAFGDLLQQGFPLLLLFRQQVLHLGAHVLVRQELVLILRRVHFPFNVPDLAEQGRVRLSRVRGQLAFKIPPPPL